jgi:hypothetical protein
MQLTIDMSIELAQLSNEKRWRPKPILAVARCCEAELWVIA